MQLNTNIDNRGRLIIPAAVKKELNYKAGDRMVLRVIKGELHVLSIDRILKEAQALLKIDVTKNENAVDDFIKSRREEFELEEAKFTRICGDNQDD